MTPYSATVFAVWPDGKMSPPANTSYTLCVCRGPCRPVASFTTPTEMFSTMSAVPSVSSGRAERNRQHIQMNQGSATIVDGARWPNMT